MRLIYMRPDQIQDAVGRNVPALLAAGVCEYHGPHLPLGVDYLIAQALVDEVEKKCECVVAPGLAFGPTMSWAGGPEDGEADFNPDAFYAYAKEELRCLADMGFRRVYVHQAHQGPDGLQASCLRRAAAELLWKTAKSWGAGWGRRYPGELPDPEIFSRFHIVPEIDRFSAYAEGMGKIPIGHGGKGETQLIMAVYPETVRMAALRELGFPAPRWLSDAEEATAEEGRKWLDFCVEGWVRELTKEM